MLADSPLFTFETVVIYYFNRFWLCEFCVLWNGERYLMEMVEIKGNINDYVE